MLRARTVLGVSAVVSVALAAGGSAHGGSTAVPAGRIVFSSDRAANLYPQLFRVGLDGSGRRQLTDPNVPVDDPALSADGTRLAYSSGHELRVHDFASGADRVVVRLGGDSVRLPKWSPDGGSIAYFDDTPQPGGERTSTLEVVPAVGGAPTSLGPAQWGSGLAWSPDGSELAYARLGASRFELVAARTDGGGSRELTPVQFGAPDIAWSPDGAAVVFTDVVRTLYGVPTSGGTPTRLVEGAVFDPAFSPDGSRIAFSVYLGFVGSRSEIATVRPDGSDFRELTANSADDRHPTWSPDGTQLLEARTLDGSAAVVVLAAEGSGERVVKRETPGTYELEPFWPRGGSSVLYVAGLHYNDRELYSIRPDGSGFRQLTHNAADDADPAVSPGGRRIAFDRKPFDPSGRRPPVADLYVMRSDGSAARRLTSTPKLSETQPAWSPDGERLAFVRVNSVGVGRVFVLDLVRHTLRAVTRPGTNYARPSWSADGRWIAFGSWDEGFQIEAVRPDGRSRHTLEPAFVDGQGVRHGADAPGWAPRGRRLAYLAGLNSVHELYDWSLAVANTATGAKRILARGVWDSRPAWSPDGATLVYSTGPNLYAIAATGRGKPRLIERAPGVSDGPSWGR